jgi:hypothetical protein
MTKEQRFQLLADCIRSDQVPHEDVPRLMAEDPEFAEWYRQKYSDPRLRGGERVSYAPIKP